MSEDEEGPADERCLGGDHTDCDPDLCFNAKVRYWREQKRAPVIVPDTFKAVRK